METDAIKHTPTWYCRVNTAMRTTPACRNVMKKLATTTGISSNLESTCDVQLLLIACLLQMRSVHQTAAPRSR